MEVTKCSCKLGKTCCDLKVDFVFEKRAFRIRQEKQEILLEIKLFPKLEEFISTANSQQKLILRRRIEKQIPKIEDFSIEDLSVIDGERKLVVISKSSSREIIIPLLTNCSRAYILFNLAQLIRESDSPLVKAFNKLNSEKK